MAHPLKAYRLARRQSQASLAKDLDVTRHTLLRWEKGISKIDENLVPTVAKRTGIPAKELRPDLVERLEQLVGGDQ